MKPKINVFNAVVILVVGALIVLGLVALGDSPVAWIIP